MPHYYAIAYEQTKPAKVVLAGSQGNAVATLIEDCGLENGDSISLIHTDIGRVVALTHPRYRYGLVVECECENPEEHVNAFLNR
jgi:hypothetical protein